MKKIGTAHIPDRLKWKLHGNPCRICDHLVDVRRPKTRHYIGGCEYRLRPGPRGGCKRFELAKCYGGHYPSF